MDRVGWRVAAIGVLLILPLGGLEYRNARAQGDESSYTSPTYGYQLSWDESWSVVEEASEGGYDLIHLSNGVSDVYVEGYIGSKGDPQTCLDDNQAYLAGDQDPESVPYVTDQDGNPIASVEEGVGFAVFDLSATEEEGAAPLYAAVQCQPVRPGVSVLVITQIVAADDYEDQADAMDALLAGLVLPEGMGSTEVDTADLEAWEASVEDDLTAFWTETFAANGETYAAPQWDAFDRPITTGCGDAAPEEIGPFYCPTDQTVYLDQTDIENNILPYGEFIVGVVLAHETGHHIQNLLGLEGCTDKGCGGRGGSLAVELQADCFSGVWAEHANAEGNVAAGDIENTIIGISAFFGDAPDTSPDDPTAHGPGALRTWWFLKGYYSQSWQDCLGKQ
jgi:predicted metalloprotease